MENITLSNTGEPNTQPIWHSVVNFKEYSTEDNISRWMVMGNTIKFLNHIYKNIMWLLLILTIMSFLSLKIFYKISKAQVVNLYFLSCLFLYWAGLSVFDASLGFEGPVNAYLVIVQPLLLLALILGSTDFIESIILKIQKIKI